MDAKLPTTDATHGLMVVASRSAIILAASPRRLNFREIGSEPTRQVKVVLRIGADQRKGSANGMGAHPKGTGLGIAAQNDWRNWIGTNSKGSGN